MTLLRNPFDPSWGILMTLTRIIWGILLAPDRKMNFHELVNRVNAKTGLETGMAESSSISLARLEYNILLPYVYYVKST